MVFTVLLVILFSMIYYSGRDNKVNVWCAVSGIFFSLGAFKEFYYFELVPKLLINFGDTVTMEQYTELYSIMTALLYYLAVPTAIIAALYFNDLNNRKKDVFMWHSIGIFIPPVIISFFYNPALTRYYQLNDKTFWYVVSAYNISYGIVLTIILISNVVYDRNKISRRQKNLVNIALLPGFWYWLVTIFVVHSLGYTELFKIWKGNSVIVSIVVIFYVVMAFKEGIMGLRLKRENYRWNSDMKMINKSAVYARHMIKNETTKIEWCIKRLKNSYGDNAPEEIDIIYRSIMHLRDFIEKTKQYSSEITLDKRIFYVEDIINESINLMHGYLGKNIEITVNCSHKIMLKCDKTHITEVLNNLISNSVEAMNMKGQIKIDTYFDKRRQYFNISIRDNGTGIDKEVSPYIFDPFFTTKRSNKNFGLGLSYCSNVMQVHNGNIEIKSSPECGTTAILHFPIKYVSEGGNIGDGENKNSVC